jgi:hypothetical protein
MRNKKRPAFAVLAAHFELSTRLIPFLLREAAEN